MEPGRVDLGTATIHLVNVSKLLPWYYCVDCFHEDHKPLINTIILEAVICFIAFLKSENWSLLTQNVQMGVTHVEGLTLMNNEMLHRYLLLPVDSQPDTCEVDQSEIRTQILLATASSALKGGRSFTHMLTEVRQAGRKACITG